MGPPKFEDIQKTAASLLNDDFQTKDFSFVAKQKTSVSSAVATSQVDWAGKEAVKTPAKISFKIPKPFSIGGLTIDKLEMDKSGKYTLEASAEKGLHKVPELKIETKCTDLESKLADTNAKFTFTGVKDLQAIFEIKPMKPADDFSAQVTKTVNDKIVAGVKLSKKNLCPDVGLSFAKGPIFAALVAKEKFSAFNVFAHYKVSDAIKLAANYDQGGKTSGNFGFGLAYAGLKGTTLKAKVQQDKSISCSVKHEVAKGFTVVSGARYDTKKSDLSYGLKLTIE